MSNTQKLILMTFHHNDRDTKNAYFFILKNATAWMNFFRMLMFCDFLEKYNQISIRAKF